jgi:hypothetical protein
MKKKALSRNEKLLVEKFSKREELMWECIRRNKDYIRDFELYNKGTLNDVQKRELAVKWHISAGIRDDPVASLADPKESYPPICDIEAAVGYYGPVPDIPQSSADIYTEESSGWALKIFRPGHTVEFPEGEKTIEHWEIQDGSKYKKLTEENCPRWISIWIEVQPWFPKSAVENALMAKFEKTYELVKDAQKAVLKKKSLGPRDDDDFHKFMMAFDYKDKNPGITLNDIALKMFPDATYENKKGKKRALPWAIDKVRYYLGRADYYVNKQGWKEL